MAQTTTTIIDAILKDDYQGPYRDQLQNRILLLKYLQKNTKNFHGRRAYIPLHTSRNNSYGTRPEGADTPTAKTQGWDQAIFRVYEHYLKIQLTQMAISSSKSNVGAFLRILNAEMKGAATDARTNLNADLWMDGSSILTGCGVTGASTTVVVNSTKRLSVGKHIQIVDVTDGTALVVGRTVDAILSPTTFTISGAAVTTTADHVITEGISTTESNASRQSGAGWINPQAVWGLHAIVSARNPGRIPSDAGDVGDSGFDQTTLNGQFGEIDRVANAVWRANEVHQNSGVLEALDRKILQQAFDEMEITGDVDRPNMGMTNHAILRNYGAILVEDKRYPAGGTVTLDGGYEALEFNGVMLVADKDAGTPKNPSVLNKIFFLSTESFELQVLEDWQWMEKDGAVLSRVNAKNAYEATMFAFMNLGNDRPNANSVYLDIEE